MTPEQSRLRWHCRRGMRELDQLLGGYLDTRYASADAATKIAFATMLDQQDPDLWDWVNGRSDPDNAHWRSIIDEIRSCHRV